MIVLRTHIIVYDLQSCPSTLFKERIIAFKEMGKYKNLKKKKNKDTLLIDSVNAFQICIRGGWGTFSIFTRFEVGKGTHVKFWHAL